MVKKKCPNCNQDSFSAAVSGKWNCPHCKTDITRVPSDDIELTTFTLEALLDTGAIKCNLLKPVKGAVPSSVTGTGLNRDEALNRGRKIIDFLNWPYEVVEAKKITWDSKNCLEVDWWELCFAGELGEAHIRLDGGNGEVWLTPAI